MARTVNRQPFSVSTSLANQDQFFNQIEWKGMSDDKNFLTSDPETFESCKNVYVDGEGLLRSRPSLKLKKFINNVINFWVFSNKILYLVKNNDRFDIKIYNDEELQYESTEGLYETDELNPIEVSDELFLFSPQSLYVYKNGELKDASDRVYVPKTKIYSGNESQNAESPNLLSNKEKHTYLYDPNLSFNTFPTDKVVNIEMDGVFYQVPNFSPESVKRIIQHRNFEYNFFVDDGSAHGAQNVWFDVISKNGYERYFLFDKSTGDFILSLDGVTVSKKLKFNDTGSIVGRPRFSQDGSLVFFITSDGAYVTSTTREDGSNYRYDGFVLQTFKDPSPNNRAFWSAYYIDADNYAVIFNRFGGTGYQELICMVVKDGSIVTFPDSEGYYEYNYYDMQPSKASNKVLEFYMCRDSLDSILIYFAGDIQQTTVLRTNSQVSQSIVTSSPSYAEAKFLSNGDFVAIEVYSNSVRYNKIEFPYTTSSSSYTTHLPTSNLQRIKIFEDGNLLTSNGIYDIVLRSTTSFLQNKWFEPLGASNYAYFSYAVNNKRLYSNKLNETVKIQVEKESKYSLESFLENNMHKPLFSVLDRIYLASANKLLINESKSGDDNEFLWYFPELSEQTFSSDITGLQPISSSQMAIFLNDEIWYSDIIESRRTYTKSKLQVGLKEGADVLTSYDGTQIIFPTNRGLVALSYQNFVASTDQMLTFLSDKIHTDFVDFSKEPVKLARYQYWIICYKENSKNAYLYDIRNQSWWPLEIFVNFTKLLDNDGTLTLLANNSLYNFDTSDNDYFDYDGKKSYLIDWSIQSQKLHLDAINNTKHIANITLMSVLNSNNYMGFKMEVTNYRKKMYTTEIQTSDYKVNAIRTFVQRVSFPKVNEFQYRIFADDEQAIRVPLSLSGLTIKYRIGSQVR